MAVKPTKTPIEGMFDDLKFAPQPEKVSAYSGIFDGVDSGDSTGGSPAKFPETSYSKITKSTQAAKEAADAAAKANSFGTIVKETLNPINLAKSAFNLAKTVVSHPIQAANEAALGVANGLTLGGVDYLQRKAFISEAAKAGMDEETASHMAEKMLAPSDDNLAALRGGFDIAGQAAPYLVGEGLLIKGMQYAAPKYALQYGRTAKLLADIGVFNAAGQINESFKPEEERNRLQRAAIDTALASTFNLGGAVFRRVRGTPFQNPFEIQPAANPNSLTKYGELVSAVSLRKGAEARIAELEGKAFLRGNQPEQLKFLKENLDNPDKLYEFNTNLPKYDGPVPDAKTVLTIETEAGVDNAAAKVAGEGVDNAAAAEGGGGTKISVATDNMDALQNYIKGSGEIDYKIVDDLGKNIKGEPIQARHEFNPKTGVHTIYATNDTTASSLAHELGHYFDTSLTKKTAGLSKIIQNFDKNREKIEDVLSSFALNKLGGQGTQEEISAKIVDIVNSIKRESDVLSSARRGKGIADPSEKFADAVSEILTGKGEGATTMKELIDYAGRFKQMNLFGAAGKQLEKEAAATAKAAEETAAKNGKQKTLFNQPKSDKIENVQQVQNLHKDVKASVSESGTTITIDSSKGIQGPSNNAVKKLFTDLTSYADSKGYRIRTSTSVPKADRAAYEKAGFKVQGGGTMIRNPEKGGGSGTFRVRTVDREVPQELPRDKTGHAPDSEPFKADKITTDEDLEVFINKKILPKITGKERIGKTNEEILTNSLKSNLTEASFDKFLTQRFGNLSEDVVQMKRLITEKATTLRETLNDREIADLSAEELKSAMTQYNQLAEMFEVFSGVRTELSNSFRSLGLAVNAGENDVLAAALESIRTAIGTEKDPFKILGKVMETRTSTPVEKYFELWYPALLSGWKTTARNLTGNASNLAGQTLSSLFTREGRTEFMPRVMAIIQANKDGLNLAKKVFKGEQNILSKYYEPAVPKEPSFSGPFAFLNNVEYVGRFLNAQDAYFSNAFKESEIAALRVGKFTYGLENKEAIDKIDEALATFAGQQGTFRNQFEKTFVGEIGSTVAKLKTSQVPAVRTFGNFIFPFVKTIANITDRRLDFVPLLNTWRTFSAPGLYDQRASRIMRDADLFNTLRRDAMDQGQTLATANTYAKNEVDRIKSIVVQRLRNQQMGRFYMGLAVTAAMAPLAVAGRITGTGPVGKNQRDVLMATGWRPNSIILPNGVALPYQNLALPISSILSILGNISDANKYDVKDGPLANNVVQGIHNFVRSELDQSFLSGLNSIYDSIAGYKPPEQLIKEFAANAIPIPAAWTQVKDVIFPERYDPKTFNEQISTKLGLPFNVFTGEEIQPRLDAFGNQTKADLIYGLTPPLLNSKTNDPVLNFMKDSGVFVGKPQKATKIKSFDGEERAITPAEYTAYVKESGAAIYEEINSRVAAGEFEGKSQEEVKKIINKIVRDARTSAKNNIQF